MSAAAAQHDEVLAHYETHLRAAGFSARTVRLRLFYAKSLLALGDVTALNEGDIEAWMNPRGCRYTAETLKSRRASARRFLGWLQKTGRIETNPAGDLHSVRVPPKPPRVISDDAFRAALEAANLRERAALMLGRYACLRLAEIAALRLEHRVGERLTIHGKGGTVRVVWITPETQAVLDELEDESVDGWYFPGRFTGHVHPEALHKIIKRVTGGWNPHSLRHAGATAAYRGTRNLRGVQAMLGHVSLATTQRYLTVDDDEMRALALATRVGTGAER